jgi:protein phosphatase
MLFGSASDNGKTRDHNEDFVYLSDGIGDIDALMIVADGLGGHSSGEVASKLAVETVKEKIVADMGKTDLADKDAIDRMIADAIKQANSNIFTEARADSGKDGMGTTIVVALFIKNHAYIGNVGDSRFYKINGGILNQVTVDHSFVDEKMRNGEMTKQEAMVHPLKNVLTRAVGTNPNVEVDLFHLKIYAGDIFMACTDGLTNMVDDERIEKIITSSAAPEQACNALIAEANKNGGIDNITAAIITYPAAFGENN